MRFSEVRAALAPSVKDIDALYAAYVAKHKTNDVERFLEHLLQQGLVSAELLRSIQSSDPLSTGTLAGHKPGGHLVGPTMSTEMLDDEELDRLGLTPVGAAPRDVAAKYVKNAAPAPPMLPPELAARATPAPAPMASRPPPSAAQPQAKAAQPQAKAAQPQATPDQPQATPDQPQATPDQPSASAVQPQPNAPVPPSPTAAPQPTAQPAAEQRAAPQASTPPTRNFAPTGIVTPPERVEPEPAKKTPPSGSRRPSLPPKVAATAAETIGAPPDVPGRGYKFVGKIGEGAMGEILVAKDLDLHRTVAYKVMSEAIVEQPALAGKFYGEAQITAQLDHPNIVPIYGLDRAQNGSLSYTMKLIRGHTFEHLIDETKEQYKSRKHTDDHSLVRRLEMFLKVCDAMYYAHTRGVVHRDLKPENIMVGAYGEVYVMDWGIAKLVELAGKSRDELVLVEGYVDDDALQGDDDGDDGDDEDVQGVIIGTPQYMSPEQAYGRKDLDARSDQYALGLILYELIALKPAVTGKSPQKIVMRQQDGEKEPFVHAFGESIPPELKGIVDKATAKAPEHRYPDVHELADDIRRYMRGEAVKARPDTPRQAVIRWVGRHRGLTLFMVFVFFTFSAFTVLGSVGWQLYAQAQARHHEQQMSHLLTSTSAQASFIDSNFARYQGLLGIVAASTVEMMIRGEPTKDTLYFAKDYDTADKAPADYGDSAHYGRKISVEQPVWMIAPNAPEFEVLPTFQKLTPVHRYLKRVVLLSHSEEASSYTPKRADRMIREIGTPVAWASVGLAKGGYIAFPGHGGIPDNFDARERPWYKLAESKREPRWGAPYIDTAGIGLVLPCATGLYDEDDKFLGVASIQLPFDYIIEKLLITKELPEGAESFLVDEEGRIVVRSSEKGKTYDTATLRNRTIRMPEFPVPEVVAEIKDLESGKVEVYEDGRHDLVLYNRMSSLGWYYVVRGDYDALLEGQE